MKEHTLFVPPIFFDKNVRIFASGSQFEQDMPE
jgi:hypothetical protein